MVMILTTMMELICNEFFDSTLYNPADYSLETFLHQKVSRR